MKRALSVTGDHFVFKFNKGAGVGVKTVRTRERGSFSQPVIISRLDTNKGKLENTIAVRKSKR